MENKDLKKDLKKLPTWAVALIAVAASIATMAGLKKPIQDAFCADYPVQEK